jgi:hypothetical protein
MVSIDRNTDGTKLWTWCEISFQPLKLHTSELFLNSSRCFTVLFLFKDFPLLLVLLISLVLIIFETSFNSLTGLFYFKRLTRDVIVQYFDVGLSFRINLLNPHCNNVLFCTEIWQRT